LICLIGQQSSVALDSSFTHALLKSDESTNKGHLSALGLNDDSAEEVRKTVVRCPNNACRNKAPIAAPQEMRQKKQNYCRKGLSAEKPKSE